MIENDQIRSRIVRAAREKFLLHGFSRVTTEELTSALGISKKTLYKFFSSKEELLRSVLQTITHETAGHLEGIIQDESMEFVEKLQALLRFLGKQFTRIGRPFMEDLQKSTPELWEEVESFRHEKLLLNFRKLFEEGMKKGKIRPDLDPEFLTLIYTSTIESVVNPWVLSKLPLSGSQALTTIIEVYFHGILTEEARSAFSHHHHSATS